MKKQLAIELAGSAKTLADLLGIKQSAISQWGDEIPELRVWQLKDIRPEWFIRDDQPKSDTKPAAPLSSLDLDHSDQERRELADRRAEEERRESARRTEEEASAKAGKKATS